MEMSEAGASSASGGLLKKREPVRVTTHMRAVRGESCSHLVLAEDEQLYIAKFCLNPQHPRLLINEWLGGYIAQRMNLPVAPSAVLNFSAATMEEYPRMGYARGDMFISYTPGLHYGSQFVGGLYPGRNAVDYLPQELMENVINLSDFIGALVFDKWTCNMDSRQAVFERHQPHLYKAIFIDHGHCFNADLWTSADIPLRGLHARRMVYAIIHGFRAFEPWLEKAARISADDLWAALSETPDQWWPQGRQDGNRLVEMLMARQHRLAETLLETRSSQPALFPSWPQRLPVMRTPRPEDQAGRLIV